ncbi:MAG: hypothetical protein LBQ66_10005, partial [Planctomycetaceae bacterium]|nr:hypothetical protein [Planctomycetaceae bacterium]
MSNVSDKIEKTKPLTIADVIMVGPRGVGKSSMLASISSQLKDTLDKLGYVSEVPDALTDKLKELKSLASSDSVIPPVDAQLLPSANETVYEIALRHSKETYVDLSCRFIDVPGGWYDPNDGNYSKVEEHLRGADVSFWCIDTVALIHNNGQYHDVLNKPDLLEKLYTSPKFALKENHTIVFTLIRSETWTKDKSNYDVDAIFKEFTRKYVDIITHIKNSHKNVNCYVCWVETVGSIKFIRFSPNGEQIQFAISSGKKFEPRNCDTPAVIAIH